MKIQAVMMMKDDIRRMHFVLDNFTKWNPDIPVTVYNCGGRSPAEEIKKYSNVQLIDYIDIWQRKTHCGHGSFSPEWFKLMFKHGLDENYTHLLFLETDVLTTKKITVEPKYDMSGVLNNCGGDVPNLYKKLNLSYSPHGGCGSTIFKRQFFEKCKDNFSLVDKIFNEMPQYFFADVVITTLGRYSGCTIGSWDDATQDGYLYLDEDGSFTEVKSRKHDAALVHNVKV